MMQRERTVNSPSIPNASGYSSQLSVWKVQYGGGDVHGIGDQAILRQNWLGLICSVQCPGSVVIKTFDAIRKLRDAGVIVAGGFHSPMEKECLEFLMRGNQPLIVVQGKSLGRPRLPLPWRAAIDAGRLLLLSPFNDDIGRTTKTSAQARNEFIASHAAAVLIPYASTGGKAEAIAQLCALTGKPFFTLNDEENGGLMERGARAFELKVIKTLLTPVLGIE
jgi:hypothetical protein